MKTLLIKISILAFGLSIFLQTNTITSSDYLQDFQGVAYYKSKTRMDLGNWGAKLSEEQKKQVAARMQNRLEKTYILTFNREESMFNEEEKLDALSGATDSWGKNFTPGAQYKNVKTNSQIQNQEFYGKKFLVKDSLQPITWKIAEETKKIGKYNCFKATALIPTNELTWYEFSWNKLRTKEKTATSEDATEGEMVEMTEVEAWFTPQIPVGHGPLEYWGLAGLILEVSAGDTTLLCSKLILNSSEQVKIEAPEKGNEVTKQEYHAIIIEKMKEFRNNRGGRSRN
ncbi:GLPGLI family protein [Lacinutrix sp.]|uniref:GLPGLI family protein n=1 Tax=Lacinutrix sp. TaxID=1937692 RepID=UPI0025B7F5DC|nr:GLPGLI family protein [Lacinutrix sp.]